MAAPPSADGCGREGGSVPSELHVRLMRASDVEDVVSLHRNLFPVKYSKPYISKFLDRMHVPLLLTSVDQNGESVIGVSMVQISWASFFSTDVQAYICTFGIQEGRRRSHLGSDLMSMTCAVLSQHFGIQTISLDMLQSNTPAFNLYQKCGFKVTQSTKNFYHLPDQNCDAYRMELSLGQPANAALANKISVDPDVDGLLQTRFCVSWLSSFFY